MTKKAIPERKKLAAVFASFSILIVGTLSLLQSMSLDYYSVVNTLQKILPAALILGGLGWVMGMILDRPRRRRSTGYNNLFLNEVLKKSAIEDNPELSGLGESS